MKMEAPMTTVRPPRRFLRWMLWTGLVTILLLITAVGELLAFGQHFDLAPLAAKHLTASLERRVTIGSLRVTPGRWLQVELRDFQLANLPDGTQPLMATVTSASAEIEAMSLLHGPLIVRALTISGLRLMLERTPGGGRNWNFGASTQTSPQKTSTRSHFPILLDARIAGEVIYKGVKGGSLITNLSDLHLHTETADKPVRLAISGSYNDAPITLEADLASLDTLRDAAAPFSTDIHVTSGDTTLHFLGNMTDPLDVDGAKGMFELIAPHRCGAPANFRRPRRIRRVATAGRPVRA